MQEVKLKSASGKDLIFTDDSDVAASTSLIIASFGQDFGGKTRLPITGPDIVGVIPLDRKTRPTVKKTAAEFGRRILMPKQDLVRSGNMVTRAGFSASEEALDDNKIKEINEDTRKSYRSHVNMVKDVTWTLHANKDVRIIMIDLFEQFYQDVCFAHYGRIGALVRKLPGDEKFRDTKEADQEIVDFINSIADKHLILTHRRKDEYEAPPGIRKKKVPTGRDTWSGYKWIGHNVNLIIEHVVNRVYDPNSGEQDQSWHYGVNVRRCLNNVMLEGPDGQLLMTDEFVTFGNLAAAVFPGTSPEDWVK